MSNGTLSWVCGLRRKTENALRTATKSVIMPEHRMAAVLNPRLKHLPVICSEEERFFLFIFLNKV